MKLPRWLVIGMWATIVLAPMVASGWWWVTWPERTGWEFIRLLQNGKRDEAREMIHQPASTARRKEIFFQMYTPVDWRFATLKPESRTLGGVLAARQRFETASGWMLGVERDEITIESTPSPFAPQ